MEKRKWLARRSKFAVVASVIEERHSVREPFWFLYKTEGPGRVLWFPSFLFCGCRIWILRFACRREKGVKVVCNQYNLSGIRTRTRV
jgi:hypothetical protein